MKPQALRGAKLRRRHSVKRKAGELAGLSAFHFFAFGALLAACLVEVLANRREQPWVAARLGAVLRLLGLYLPVLGIG
jgi:hypothetical protein